MGRSMDVETMTEVSMIDQEVDIPNSTIKIKQQIGSILNMKNGTLTYMMKMQGRSTCKTLHFGETWMRIAKQLRIAHAMRALMALMSEMYTCVGNDEHGNDIFEFNIDVGARWLPV